MRAHEGERGVGRRPVGTLVALSVSGQRATGPFVGRDEEIAEAEQTLDGGSPVGVVVTGLPGTGRTRLAREVASLARDRDWTVHWATATTATRSVTFGALAHLVPGPLTADDRLALLHDAAEALSGSADGCRALLVVDDAHLLDELSVALVHQLVVGGSAVVVITAPTHGLPHWVGALGKDRLAVRFDLSDFTRDDTDRLVRSVVGADVDARTAERIWHLTGGNPQLVTELVRAGRRTGDLQPVDGFWRWTGEIAPTPALVDLALGRLGDPGPQERLVVDVLATVGTLAVDHLVTLGSPAAVEELERSGLVTIAVGTARLTYPLLALAVRAVLPESTLRRIGADVVRLVDADGGRRTPTELVRISELRLESGEPQPAARLVEAAEHANARLDHVAAERLARTAVGAGEQRAVVPLVEAVQWLGRAGEVERLCAQAVRRGVDGRDRVTLGLARSVNLFCGLCGPDSAAQVLAETADVAEHPDDRAAVVATRALLELLAGRPVRAVELGEQVLHGAPAVRPLAAAAVAGALAVLGRPDHALVAVAVGRAALEEAPQGTSAALARIAMAQAEVVTLMLAGRCSELGRRAAELHADCMGTPQGVGDAVAALHQGWAALARGAVAEARVWQQQAVAGLRRADPAGMLPLALSQLALVEAVLGDAKEARTLLSELDGVPTIPLYEPYRVLAESWALAAEGGDGGSVARRGAAACGQPALELVMLHTAVRLGHPASDALPRIDALAVDLDTSHAATLAAHVRAVVSDDGPGLEAVADAFTAVGARLRAADSLAQAARAYEHAGHRRAAASAHARAQALALACDVHGTPALAELTPTRLTGREDEIARLAARGMNNQAIAARLVLSVRTVEAHLAKVYTKLGITGRHELNRAMIGVSRTG